MRHPYSHHHGLGRLAGNILVLLLIAWAVLAAGAWLGWTASPACYAGRGLVALASSQLLEGLAVILAVVWATSLFTWRAGLVWALVLVGAGAWTTGQAPAWLASC